MWSHGAVGVEELDGALRAAFTDEATATLVRDSYAPYAPVERFDDTHGLDMARDLLTVEIAGRFAVHPPWCRPPVDRLGIEIDPGHAFGSGSHASTKLGLALIGEEDPPASTVFDIGCGSGVLAIAAARLGAQVTAVDTDPAAVAATVANAERNGVAEQVTALVASADLLDGPVGLVTVNVTIDVHEQLAPLLHESHRRLIVTGLLGRPQLDRCAAAYDASIERAIDHDGWMAAVLTRS